jgi:hypothetical protein
MRKLSGLAGGSRERVDEPQFGAVEVNVEAKK